MYMKRSFTTNIKSLAVALLLAVSIGAMGANAKQTVSQVTSAVEINTNVDYTVTGDTPFSSSGVVNLVNTDHAVVILSAVKPSAAANWLSHVKINGANAVNGTNCQVKMYNKGCIILPYASSFMPLTCYTGTDFSGTSYNGYTTGSNGGYMKTLTDTELNNNFRSFKLKRGYMVTFATGTTGWGYSRCFIAATADLEMNLPTELSGKISSYRLFKWQDFGKTGIANETRAEVCSALNVQGCYTYGEGGNLLPDVEWLPHKIQKWWPGVGDCGNTENSCTMKTDNEPANPNDPPDKPDNATVDEVLGYWEDAMRTGMRLCSPSTYDGSNNKAWFDKFFAAIDERGWRCDIYDIHCYWADFSALSTHYNYYKRPLLISEWMWGASWNSNGAFGSGVTDDKIKSETSKILNTLNGTAYVERYFYWNSESKAHVYEKGSLTDLGKVYAATDGGLGYNKSYEFIPKVVLKQPYSLSGTISGSDISFTWKDSNGDMMDEIRVQYKSPSASSWTTLATVERQDKTGREAQSYSYTGTLDNAEDCEWRIQDVLDGRTYESNTLKFGTATSSTDNATFLPTNLSDFFFQFYSKEAGSDLVWAVAPNGEDRVQYKAYNSNHGDDPYQLWVLEPNSNGGYSLRNLGEPGYLIASPKSWNFVTRNSEYTEPQAAYGFDYNSSGDYWVCRNLCHNMYVGLWDNDKNFAAGEVLAGNRDSEATADHIGIRMILRSEIGGGDVSPTVGQSYYLYSVDAGKFLTGGNSHGTHASLGSNGLKWTLEQPTAGLYSLVNENGGYLYATDQDGLWVDGSSTIGAPVSDVTGTYLTNAEFSSGTVQNGKVFGYGKDGSPYGYQSVSGWSSKVVTGDNSNSSYPNSGMAGGIFSYGSTTGMLQGGGKTPPSAGPNGESGQCLGLLGVWGCGGYYYQNVTLPAGSYNITYTVYNASGTNDFTKNFFGFIANNGKEYLSSQKSVTVGQWTTVTVDFVLTASTAGKICAGFTGTGGSDGSPHIFIDKVAITKSGSITHDTQHTRFFALSQGSDDTYTIQPDPQNPHLGTSALGGTRSVGFVGDLGNTPYVLAAPKDSYHSGVGTKWILMSPRAYTAHRMTIIEAAPERRQMWALVISARAAGVGDDEIAVYENPLSTASEIADAAESLRAKLLEVEASETTPVDYSFLITNGDCASSSFEGWTTESSWGSHTTFYHNGDALLTNRFYESWVQSGTLSDRSISQTFTDLPAGVYRLSLDIIATQQSDATKEVTGVTLFLGDQEVSCHTANGVPETFTTPELTVAEGGQVALGLKVAGTTANWVAFDNFRLIYLGLPPVPNDLTGDRRVDADDVRALVSHLLGISTPEGFNIDAADINGDEEVNISDVTALITLILSDQ